MNKAICRGCGKPILWIKTKAGKAMPCDPSPVAIDRWAGSTDKILTATGEVITGEITTVEAGNAFGYRPHWGTCPAAGKFKRGGATNGKE